MTARELERAARVRGYRVVRGEGEGYDKYLTRWYVNYGGRRITPGFATRREAIEELAFITGVTLKG